MIAPPAAATIADVLEALTFGDLVLRLIAAAGLGALIGMNRERRRKPAERVSAVRMIKARIAQVRGK